MTATTLILVRHGQTDWNLARRYQGQKDIPLNATGIWEAYKAAGALKNVKFDGIISSDQLRAHRTAELIGEFHDMPVQVDKRLREISFGEWEGMTWDEIEAGYPEESRLWRENEMPGAPGGETFATLGERTAAFLESMRGKGGTYAIVAHGGTIRSMVATCLGMKPRRSWQFQIKNVSISELALYDGATVLNRWNDTNHLKREGKIRPISIALFEHERHIFVAEGHDPVRDHTFYRPLGGGIEFGETGEEALRREMREELNAELSEIEYLKTVENIFTHGGEAGHELVQLYRAKLTDSSWYDLDRTMTHDEEGFTARWVSLDVLAKEGAPPLYPDGLLDSLL